MKQGWEYKKLGEVCTLISDGSHNPPKGVNHSTYRMISSQNVFDDNLLITNSNVRYITESDHLIPQFGIRIVHKKVGSFTNILYLYR